MAEIQHQPLTSPPQKNRDSLLTARSKDELVQRQEEYIGETIKSAARESLRQETMAPTPVCIGKVGKEKLRELQDRLRAEQKVLLNMALAYAYDEARRRQVPVQELRAGIEAMLLDEESISFEMNEPTLDIIFESGIQDAQFIYLNAGLDLLHSRIVKLDTPSTIWK